MAWNEPGGSDKKDPWGNRKPDQGPPDLDEVIKKLQSKFGSLFGGKGGGGGGGSSGGAHFPGGGSIGISFVLLVLLAVWALSGFYVVTEGTRGVVLRLGALHSDSAPGLHWYPRFIDSVEVVDIEQVYSIQIGGGTQETLMLTRDENIVDMEFVVQYNIADAYKYLFNVRNPEISLPNIIQTAVREIVGNNDMRFITTDGRSEIAAQAFERIQEILDAYDTGLLVRGFNMQKALAPREVLPAFDDVAAAREDRERFINEAQAYANDILPRVEGRAQRMIEEAMGYQEQIVSVAKGESDRFLKVLEEYKRAPQVTRERLYIETMEEVYASSNKVMIDLKSGNSLMYLPLDQLMKRSGSSGGIQAVPPPSQPGAGDKTEIPDRFRDRSRSREVR